MEGIEILNKTMITEPILHLFLLGIIGLIVGGGIFLIGWNEQSDYDGLNATCIIIGAIIFVAGLVGVAQEKDTGRYKYEVTIDESVSMTDVHEKYKVVEQKGKIWILEDKEN